MRRVMTTLLMSALALAPSMALAQQSGATAMPEPATSQPMKPAATATRSSCFGVAMQFDHAMEQKMMGADLASAKQIAGDATALRNQGIAACQAGDRQGGRKLLEAAHAAL